MVMTSDYKTTNTTITIVTTDENGCSKKTTLKNVNINSMSMDRHIHAEQAHFMDGIFRPIQINNTIELELLCSINPTDEEGEANVEILYDNLSFMGSNCLDRKSGEQDMWEELRELIDNE